MATRYRRFRDMREDHDMTQKVLAEKLGVNPVQYSRYEHGTQDMPLYLLIELARMYNTSTDYLLGLTDDPNPLPPPVAYPHK